VSRWKLTVRHGSEVQHSSFEELDEAIAVMRAEAHAIQAEGPLPAASMLRDYEARDQVNARLQIVGKGLLSKPTAGVDVRGDCSLVAYRGALRRQELEPKGRDTPFDAVRETLAGA
jgi:hypothetical protein